MTSKHGTTMFFSHYNLFLGKLKEKLARKARVNTERVYRIVLMPPGYPIILLKSNEFNMAAVSVKRSIGRRGKLGLLRVFLIKTAPSATWAGRWYFFLLNATMLFLLNKNLSFFTNEFSGFRSRVMTSSCRNKKIPFSGKENSAIFSNNVLYNQTFSP